jgi:hypothetical protein
VPGPRTSAVAIAVAVALALRPTSNVHLPTSTAFSITNFAREAGLDKTTVFVHLYRNRGDRTFEDVKAGLDASGWGQGACVGDYDNDGRDDLLVTYWGWQPPVSQRRQRTSHGAWPVLARHEGIHGLRRT